MVVNGVLDNLLMKRVVYILPLAVLLISCLLLGSCGDNSRATALLSCADSLMADRPDSALQILDGLLTDSYRLSKHFTMQCRLRRLNAINKLDTVFTTSHVSQAKALTDHFDNHGTPNEQMLAYYLLGRTYADAGEAPCAIDAYNTAADRADTTAIDCDYKTLCRVYSQMANVFYRQGLYHEDLIAHDRAVHYGYLAGDTLAALLAYSQKMDAYKMLMLPDSMLYVCETVSSLFQKLGYMSKAADVLGLPIRYLCDQDSLIKAKRFLEIYERESGFFDENHNIAPGREIYYYTKGYYYLKTCQYDSAEYFFRKELATGKDFNNQNAGARGLAQLFQQIHKPDSLAKYALYSYAMNDSVYAHKATNEVAKTKALYDYNRYERIANEKTLKAERFKFSLIMVCALAVILLLLVVLIYIRHQNEKRRLEDRIRLLRGYAINEQLHDAPIAHQFRQLLKENPYKMPDLNDWKALSSLIDQEVPAFRTTLNGGSHTLTDFEYDVCMLIKIQIPASDIAKLKQCAPSYITQTRKNIFQNLFSKKGRADELDEYIMSLS